MEGFRRICIDALDKLDLSQLQAGDLRWQYGTGQAKSTGYGRDRKYSYRHGVQTPIGDIELSVWVQAAEAVVKREGLQEEVRRLMPFMAYCNSHAEVYAHALDACLSKLYCDTKWVSFLEYNQKYHPELLEAWDGREE